MWMINERPFSFASDLMEQEDALVQPLLFAVHHFTNPMKFPGLVLPFVRPTFLTCHPWDVNSGSLAVFQTLFELGSSAGILLEPNQCSIPFEQVCHKVTIILKLLVFLECALAAHLEVDPVPLILSAEESVEDVSLAT